MIRLFRALSFACGAAAVYYSFAFIASISEPLALACAFCFGSFCFGIIARHLRGQG